MPSKIDEPEWTTCDMMWMLALSQGMSFPLCQMFFVVCNGMARTPSNFSQYSGVGGGQTRFGGGIDRGLGILGIEP
jgi:hypothetical protein